MNKIEKLSNENLNKANEIIQELKIEKIWEGLNSTCNLVGSVKTGLIFNHLDIDFHIYSDDFSIEKSFKAIAEISKNKKIKEVYYKNLLDAEDMCLEWHLNYEETPQRVWTIDIIHIKNESPYAGMIENVTNSINKILTDELKSKILELKYECGKRNEKVAGIEIYEAVIDNNIGTFEELQDWRKSKENIEISLWEPKINRA